MSRIHQAIEDVKALQPFMSQGQLHVMADGCRSSEKGYFFD